jgi:hypothetical protein
LIVLAALGSSLLLGWAGHSHQLQGCLITVEVIEQVAAQGSGIDLIVLAPPASLLAALGSTDIASEPASLQLSIQHITQGPRFVDYYHFLGRLVLLLDVQQKLCLASELRHRPNRALINLAGRLITFQVHIDPHDDSFCFWPSLALLFHV